MKYMWTKEYENFSLKILKKDKEALASESDTSTIQFKTGSKTFMWHVKVWNRGYVVTCLSK